MPTVNPTPSNWIRRASESAVRRRLTPGPNPHPFTCSGCYMHLGSSPGRPFSTHRGRHTLVLHPASRGLIPTLPLVNPGDPSTLYPAVTLAMTILASVCVAAYLAKGTLALLGDESVLPHPSLSSQPLLWPFPLPRCTHRGVHDVGELKRLVAQWLQLGNQACISRL